MNKSTGSNSSSIFIPESNSALVLIAKMISFVINPNFCQFFIFIYFRNYTNLALYAWSFFYLAIFPLIGYLIYVKYVLKRDNLFVLERKRRFIPFSVNVISIGLFHLTLIYFNYVEPNTSLIMQFLWFLNIFAMIITIAWRISIHQIATAASFALIMVMSSGLVLSNFNLILLMILISVGWSRYYLRGHTLPQIIAGSFVGYISIIGYMYFIGKLTPV